MPQGEDRARMPGDDNFASEDIFTSGMLSETLEKLRYDVQLISPKANEQVVTSTIAVGPDPFAILPYDRNRVRVVVKVPALALPPLSPATNYPQGAPGAAQTGGVFIGDKETVRAGWGFWLAPGDMATIESIDELHARATSSLVYITYLIEREGGDVR